MIRSFWVVSLPWRLKVGDTELFYLGQEVRRDALPLETFLEGSTEKIMSSFCLRSSLGLLIHGPLGLAPKGLQDLAQGFNPGNPQNEWFALKGREMRLRDKSRTH